MQRLIKNGELRFDTRALREGHITIYIDGDVSGGALSIDAVAGRIRANVADAGPFDETNKDRFERVVKRVVIDGSADEILVTLSDAVSPDLLVEVI